MLEASAAQLQCSAFFVGKTNFSVIIYVIQSPQLRNKGAKPESNLLSRRASFAWKKKILGAAGVDSRRVGARGCAACPVAAAAAAARGWCPSFCSGLPVGGEPSPLLILMLVLFASADADSVRMRWGRLCFVIAATVMPQLGGGLGRGAHRESRPLLASCVHDACLAFRDSHRRLVVGG